MLYMVSKPKLPVMNDERKTSWNVESIEGVYNLPLLELVFRAAQVHRENHDARKVQISSLISIKTGGCPEDCAYCPQAARYHTHVKKSSLLEIEEVATIAQKAKENKVSRICMGAAWRNVEDNEDFEKVLEMVRTLNKSNVEVCCTLGMITESQARKLSEAGLYAYNHNIDTSEDYYKKIISTRGYKDRLKTLSNVRKSNLTVCSGGIIGMGEETKDRCAMLATLANLTPPPESVPINALVAVEGTPLADQQKVSSWDIVRTIATARIVLPKSTVRLSAGRESMNDETQALCFLSGAGSIFSGDKLLTTPNPPVNEDKLLFEALGLLPTEAYEKSKKPTIKETSPSLTPIKSRVKWSRPGHKIPRNMTVAREAKQKKPS